MPDSCREPRSGRSPRLDTVETSQLQQLTLSRGSCAGGTSRVNLTRLVEGDDYWINQVFDSLWPLQRGTGAAPEQKRRLAIDVGTGGGFPGLAVAIALPQHPDHPAGLRRPQDRSRAGHG